MNNIEDIELYWIDAGSEDTIFSQLSVETDYTSEAPDLNQDIIVGYKKTALSEIVIYFMDKIDVSDDDYISKIKFFFYNILLLSVYPKATKMKFSDSNDFRDIIDLIKDDYGDQYILKSDLQKIPENEKVINMLVNNKLLTGKEDRYVVIDYYLKNLKVFDKKKDV